MAEWFKATVLKTVVGASQPGVRIPLSPFLASFIINMKSMKAFFKNIFDKLKLPLGEFYNFIILLISFISLLFTIIVPFYFLLNRNYSNTVIIMEFLKITLWPLLVIFLIFQFRKEISLFLGNIKVLNIMGNSVSTDYQKNRQENDSNKNGDDSLKLKNSKEYITVVKELNVVKETDKELKERLERIEVELEFERIYNLIFGSQIFLLKLLVNNSMGAYDIINYYQSVILKFVVLHTWDFNLYLRILVNNNLITIDQNIYKITPKGILFIKYIEVIRQYNLNKDL